MGGVNTACTSEETVTLPAESTTETENVINLAKTPDFLVYSGDVVLENTLGKSAITRAASDGKPDATVVTDQVEINLSINDKKEEGDYISSHLSIHARANSDLKIWLPISADFYCQADDMYIARERVGEAYGSVASEGTVDGDVTLPGAIEDDEPWFRHNLTTELGGNEVWIQVDYYVNRIEVHINGMNEDVLKYCHETYDNDGLTFEIWNYYNEEKTREAVKAELDKSTVAFAHAERVMAYINAFNELDKDPETGIGHRNEWDCKVALHEDVKQFFNDRKAGYNWNNSQYNVIYFNKLWPNE